MVHRLFASTRKTADTFGESGGFVCVVSVLVSLEGGKHYAFLIFVSLLPVSLFPDFFSILLSPVSLSLSLSLFSMLHRFNLFRPGFTTDTPSDILFDRITLLQMSLRTIGDAMQNHPRNKKFFRQQIGKHTDRICAGDIFARTQRAHICSTHAHRANMRIYCFLLCLSYFDSSCPLTLLFLLGYGPISSALRLAGVMSTQHAITVFHCLFDCATEILEWDQQKSLRLIHPELLLIIFDVLDLSPSDAQLEVLRRVIMMLDDSWANRDAFTAYMGEKALYYSFPHCVLYFSP